MSSLKGEEMKKIFLVTVILSVISIANFSYAASTAIKDIKTDDRGMSVKLTIMTDTYAPIECYDISTPPQLIVDFMGDVYTDLRDIQVIDKGPVKQIRIVKGTKTAPDLGASFYAVDFLIIDLVEPKPYEFSHAQNVATLEVAKEKMLTAAESAPAPAVIESVPAAQPVLVKERVPELPPAAVTPATKEPPKVAVKTPAPAEEEIKLPPAPQVAEVEEEQKEGMMKKSWRNINEGGKSVGKGIWKGITSVGKGIKKAATFPKKKKAKKVKKIPEPKAKQAKAVKVAKQKEKWSKDAKADLDKAQAEKDKKDTAVKQAMDGYLQAQTELDSLRKTAIEPDDKSIALAKETEAARKNLDAAETEVKKAREIADTKLSQYNETKNKINAALSGNLLDKNPKEFDRIQNEYQKARQDLKTAIDNAKTADEKVKLAAKINEEKQKQALNIQPGDKSGAAKIKQAEAKLEVSKDKMERAMVEQKKSEEILEKAKQRYASLQVKQDEQELSKAFGAISTAELPTPVPAKEKKPHKATPEEAKSLRSKGFELQAKGEFDQAIKYYQQAILANSNYPDPHNDLGIIYEQKNWPDRAKEEYLIALKIDPNYVKAYSNLALLYEQEGDIDKAIYYWQKRVELGDPKDRWTEVAQKRIKELQQ